MLVTVTNEHNRYSPRVHDTTHWQIPLVPPRDALFGEAALIYIKIHPFQIGKRQLVMLDSAKTHQTTEGLGGECLMSAHHKID